MGLLVTILRRGHFIGGMDAKLCDILFDSSYPTGGESLSGSEAGLTAILAAIDVNAGLGNGSFRFNYNLVTSKLLAYRSGAGGVQVYSQGDIKGSANTDLTGVGGASPTNGALLVTLAAANNTTPLTIALQPDIPRNFGVGLKNNTGGASAGNASNYAIVGTFRGAAQTETLAFSTGDLATIANGSFCYKYCSKPYDTITSITPSAAQPANWQVEAGPGSKLGLPWELSTPAEADIIKLTKNAADLPITGLYSNANKTVLFGTLADGDDIVVEANTAGGFVEVGNTADLSAVTARMLLIG